MVDGVRDAARRGKPADRSSRDVDTVETRASWGAAALAMAILSISYGAPLIVVVALKPIAAALDADRSVIALAVALVWIGTGIGGILMGWMADRIGVRRIVIFGALMTALGLAVSSLGHVWALYLGHALLIGFLGGGALYPPLLIYVSRWFDWRCGTALALISSGQYIAGVIWPTIFQHALSWFGWRATMLGFAGAVVLIVPMALQLLPAPQPRRAVGSSTIAVRGTATLGLRPNTVQSLVCAAAFLCCVPMAMPSSHLVAFCSDLESRRRRGRRCCRCCLAAPSSAGCFGDGSPTVSAGSPPCSPPPPARHWRSRHSR